MTRPQLFQHVEPNITGIVTMVTFQKQDSALVYAHQKTLEAEIQQVIADDEEHNVFVNDEDGIWFGRVNKTRTGCILATQQRDKSSLDYTKKIERVLHSPPKKRGGGIPPSPSFSTHHIQLSNNPVPPITTLAAQWNSSTTSSIDAKFADIQIQFSKQQEHNVNSKAIDGKMDRLLNFYEDRTFPPTKLQRINATNLDMSQCSERHVQLSNTLGQHQPHDF